MEDVVQMFINKIIASVEEDDVEIGYEEVEYEFDKVVSVLESYFGDAVGTMLMREVSIQKGNMYEVVLGKVVPLWR
jgi:hypothetical protein